MQHKVLAMPIIEVSEPLERLRSDFAKLEQFLLGVNEFLRQPLLNALIGHAGLRPPGYSDLMPVLEGNQWGRRLIGQLAAMPTKHPLSCPVEVKPNEERHILGVDFATMIAMTRTDLRVQANVGLSTGVGVDVIQAIMAKHGWKVEVFERVSQAFNGHPVLTMVKEPYGEINRLVREHPELILFMYLHPNSPGSRQDTKEFADLGVSGYSYDCFRRGLGLTPMSLIAAMEAVIEMLTRNPVNTKQYPGRPPILRAGLSGVSSLSELTELERTVLVLGIGGVAGQMTAMRLLANGVNVIGTDVGSNPMMEQLRSASGSKWLTKEGRGTLTLIKSDTIKDYRDLLNQVIGVVDCIKIPRKPTPILITAEMLKGLLKLLVSIAVDEGAAIEGFKATSNAKPWDWLGECTTYGPPNIPSTQAGIASMELSRVMGMFAILLAKLGPENAELVSPLLREALVYRGGQVYGIE